MNADRIMFIDLQGFKTEDNQFIIKEFSLSEQGYTQTFLVKPPYSFNTLSKVEQKRVRWLEKNRGIYWSDGFIDYREFKRIIMLYLKNRTIFVKGTEKIKWLQELCLFCKIINIEEMGCPNLEKLNDMYIDKKYDCVYHSKTCALKNVIFISKWCQDHKHLF